MQDFSKVGRPRLPARERLDAKIKANLTQEEREQFIALAETKGMAVSVLIRQLIQEALSK